MNFIVYDNDGAILRTGYCPNQETMLLQAGEGESVMEGEADDEIHYISNGFVTEKDTIDPVITVDDNTLFITEVPNPCEVLIDGSGNTVEDDNVEIEFEKPGTYEIQIRALHHITWKDEIEV